MLPAYGLHGHIRNNAIKSAVLIAGFLVLVALFWTGWCIIYTAIADYWWPQQFFDAPKIRIDLTDILHKSLARALDRWWLPIAGAVLWFILAYTIHADMIRLATGALPVTRKQMPKLYNLVENLTIATGLPMPRIEIIPSNAMNAYAAGLTPGDSVVAVTRGLLDTLTDDELEAVLAHEITHIKNRDVQLMVVATVFAGGLTLLGDGIAKYCSDNESSVGTGRNRYSDGSSSDSGGGANFAPIAMAIVIGIVCLCLAHLFALLIKFAISRSREFMADAGAVELTKNPDALMSALKKISGHDIIPGLHASLQPMMISAVADRFFSTHPPIDQRIAALQTYAGGRLVQDHIPRRAPRLVQQSNVREPAAAVGAMGFGRRRTQAQSR